MQHSNFVHLHLHTQYSLLDGTMQLDQLFQKALEFKMPALAITDHGSMFGAVAFFQKAVKNGIKPIIGCEVYIAPESRFKKVSRGISEASYHLTLLVKNEQGYKNLMRLVTSGYLEGFYYRPRIDKEILAQHAEGLIALSGCLKGEIPHLIYKGQVDKAKKTAKELKKIMGEDNFYLEIQRNGVEGQEKVNQKMIEFGRELSIPLVATNDCHYLYQEDSKTHDILLCIQTGKTVSSSDRLKFSTNQFYFRSPEEMIEIFKDIPEAIENTIVIAERCNLDLKFKGHLLPHYQVPENYTLSGFLRETAEKGLAERLEKIKPALPLEDYKNRLDEELKMIEAMHFPGYFLIVWDFINFAKKNGIPVGPGRGSVAGSLAAYALGITDIDPIPYGLLFERFLNPERVTMPDIDIDFCMDRRDEVIDYVRKKYGNDHVAQIITFGTLQAKGVIRDVGRTLDMPYAEVDKIAKLVPNVLNITLEDALEKEPKLRELEAKDEKIMQLIEIAKSLEGLTRHASTHAAGIVISQEPLTEYTPLYRGQKGEVVTQYAMKELERIGLTKFDFLGLRTLTVINNTFELVKKKTGQRELEIPLDDSKTYKLLSAGETTGVFQLESSGMKDLLRKLGPEKFEDIIALVALYRPGPLASGMVDDFIKRKHGKISIKYELPELKDILKETYGVIVYQEQVMQIASKLAGFSLGEADLLRRAMGKKKPEEMEKQKERFLEGAKKNAISSKKAEKVFDLMAHFAGYGFNKSHSAAYALIAYQTAYLKAHYPVEFLAALLTSEMENTDKIVKYIGECREMGINILPPDINESYKTFTVVGGNIRFGLAAVKNVGEGAIKSIISGRKKRGQFTSIFDFCEHVDLRKVNKRVIEGLIKCGAFDSTGARRSQLMDILDQAIEVAQQSQKDKMNGQISMFETFEEDKNYISTFETLSDIEEWPESQLLKFEKEHLGFYITGHPLAKYEKKIKRLATTTTLDVFNCTDGSEVSLCGIVGNVKQVATKKGALMAFVSLEDLQGSIEVVVFPEIFKTSSSLLDKDDPILVKGKVDIGEKSPKIIANEIMPLAEAEEKLTSSIHIKLLTPGLSKESLSSLKNTLKNSKGNCRVFLHFFIPEQSETIIAVSEKIKIYPNESLINNIKKLFGENTVSLQ